VSDSFIDKKIKKIFGNRMQIADTIRLRQKSTYILPTKAGFLLAGVVVLMMIAATNYQNNLAFLLTFLVVSVGLVSMLFTFKNLQGLIFKLGLAESVFAGKRLQVNVHLSSQEKQNHFTIGTGFSKSDIYFIDVLADLDNQVIVSIKTEQRGWFDIPRLMVTSNFPFGLFRIWAWIKFASPTLIYPKPIEPPIKGSQGNSDDEQQQENNLSSGNEDLYGLKTYQVGEPISRIDWKAVARERGLFTKEFVAYQSQNLVFDWNDFPSTEKELRLSYLCYLVIEASQSNFEYALRLPENNISINSGETHKRNCLDALALYGVRAD